MPDTKITAIQRILLGKHQGESSSPQEDMAIGSSPFRYGIQPNKHPGLLLR
jgi:hypothetical protein